MSRFDATSLASGGDLAASVNQLSGNGFPLIELGDGNFTLDAKVQPSSSWLRIVGEGIEQTTLTATVADNMIEPAASCRTLLIEDLTLDGDLTATTLFRAVGQEAVVFTRCRFTGWTSNMLRAVGVRKVLFLDCEWWGNNETGTQSWALSVDDCARVQVSGGEGRALWGFLSASDDSALVTEGDITIERIALDGLWYLERANVSTTVTAATATSLTPAAAPASFSAFNDHFRFYVTAATGTITSAGFGSFTLGDTTASFPTMLVGDLVTTGDGYAGIILSNDATTVSVEEWLDSATMLPKVGRPAVSGTYTLSRVRVGKVESESAGVYDIERWVDLDGETASPPATSSNIDFIQGGTFGVQVSESIGTTTISQCRFRRFRGDQCALQSGRGVVTGNHFIDGQDGGLTIWGARHAVTGNRFQRQRGASIFMVDAEQCSISGNSLYKSNVERITGNVGAINMSGACLDNAITGNVIDGGGAAGCRWGIALRGTTTGTLIEANAIMASVESPILDEGGGGGSIIRGGVLEAGAQGVIGYVSHTGAADTLDISGSGTPEANFKATVGSMFRRTDTGQLYMKTTGVGDTGWTVLT